MVGLGTGTGPRPALAETTPDSGPSASHTAEENAHSV